MSETGYRTGPAHRGPSAIRLVWVYPDLLSTYGDRGNLLVLARRARLRGRPVFVAGERQLDLAVRLEADEVAFRMVGGIDEAIAAARGPSMEVIANYTAFQQIRAALGRAV